MRSMFLSFFSNTDNVEAELLHTFTKVYKFDTMLLLVRLAVLTAVTLTVPIVLFPVSTSYRNTQSCENADVFKSMLGRRSHMYR